MIKERRTNVRGIAYRDGKLLCVRQKSEKGQGTANNYWNIPGGGLDLGENITDGLVREMVEETGVIPVVGKILFIQQLFFEDLGKEYMDFFVEIKNADDYLSIDLTKTTHGELEIAEIGFIDRKTHLVLPKFLSEIDIAECISNDHPVPIYTENVVK